MIRFKTVFFLLLLCGACFQGHTGTTAELLKAQNQLDSRGEVYYCFYVNSLKDIGPLSDIISLDKFEGTCVYAYANRQEFDEFLKYGFYYEVLTPPSLAATGVVMSDYENITFPLTDWTKYPTYTGYQNILTQLQTTYPQFIKVQELGTSNNNRKLLVANVSKNAGTRECEPKFLWNAGIHGDELLPIMLTLRLMEWLCVNYGKDARATRILDSIDLWMSPMLNPDGTYKGGDNTVTGAIRYNAKNVDMNRNYSRLPGLGTNPTPEKETKIYMDYEKLHVFVMGLGWHSGTEGISYPWSCVSRSHIDDPWFMYISRKFADTVQSKGPNGFFDDINNGAGQGYQHLYPATGTEKDYLVYFHKNRSNCIESSTEKILPESKLEAHWGYYLNAMLTYTQQCLNGIRGTVTDSVTGAGKKAKIWVDNHDKTDDSSQVYADLPHGNYYRPIIKGTYKVTYSCAGCVSKSVSNIVVENDKATIVNVKLDCGSTPIKSSVKNSCNQISILQTGNRITIECRALKSLQTAAIFDMSGRMVKSLRLHSAHEKIIWDGTDSASKRVSAGGYIVYIKSIDGNITKPFIYTNR